MKDIEESGVGEEMVRYERGRRCGNGAEEKTRGRK